MSHTGYRFLFCVFQINLEEVLWTIMMKTEVIMRMMGMKSLSSWVNKRVLEMISTARENIEIKGSSREPIVIFCQIEIFAKAHGQWIHCPGFVGKYQKEEKAQYLSSGHLL